MVNKKFFQYNFILLLKNKIQQTNKFYKNKIKKGEFQMKLDIYN